MNNAIVALAESQEKVRLETELSIAETQQKIAALTSQRQEARSEWESSLDIFRQALAHCKEQEVEQFRAHLRNILTTMLSSLG